MKPELGSAPIRVIRGQKDLSEIRGSAVVVGCGQGGFERLGGQGQDPCNSGNRALTASNGAWA
jgi:hypothetical protein